MNITKLTRKYISEHASVRDCLRQGLVNFSALARLICKEQRIDQFDAVLVACRRYSEQYRGTGTQEAKVRSLIKNAKIRTRNKISAVIIDKPANFKPLYEIEQKIRAVRGDLNIIEGEEVVVIVTNSEHVDLIKRSFARKVVQVTDELVQICMIFDKKIEITPGVVSHIYGMLADKEINVREEMSCWTDVMLLVDEAHAAKALRVLSLKE
ncbi:MAG: hypothetical protein KDD42_06680 [Bdellovibrionales bacterium]|nr:hypothetical protein [Bdellovibrionales bacterium]